MHTSRHDWKWLLFLSVFVKTYCLKENAVEYVVTVASASVISILNKVKSELLSPPVASGERTRIISTDRRLLLFKKGSLNRRFMEKWLYSLELFPDLYLMFQIYFNTTNNIHLVTHGTYIAK